MARAGSDSCWVRLVRTFRGMSGSHGDRVRAEVHKSGGSAASSAVFVFSIAAAFTGLSSLLALLVALLALLLAVAFAGLCAVRIFARLIILPWRNWREFQTEKPPDNPRLLQDTEKDRRPLLAFVALLLNSLFFLFVVASFVPMLALNPCG